MKPDQRPQPRKPARQDDDVFKEHNGTPLKTSRDPLTLPEPKPVKFPRLALLKAISNLILHMQFGNKTKDTPMKLKPGVTTTEFYITLGSGLCTTALAVLGLVDGTYAVAGVTILGAVYTLIRGSLKKEGS